MANQPGTLRYPANLDDTSSLFNAANNAATTMTLSATSSDVTFTVASTTLFSSSGSFTVDSEIVYYTGKTSTTFTGCTRGCESTTAASHSVGATAEMLMTAAYHDILTSAVVALQTKIGTTSSTPIGNQVLVGNGTGTSVWSDQVRIANLGLGVAPAAMSS